MIRLPRPLLSAAAFGLLFCSLPAAYAGPTIYSGGDPDATPGDPHPNTDDARSRFDAAASTFGTLTQLDFESVPLSQYTFTTRGVDVVGVNNDSGITDDSAGDSIIGFNTTPGGSQFLQFLSTDIFAAVTETFSFTNGAPITAFGATFTGVGTSSGITQITFRDGTMRTEVVPGSASGGVLFFGFTDSLGNPIQSVTVGVFPDPTSTNATKDVIGLDDVLLYNGTPSGPTLPAPVPEASSGLGLGFGLILLGGLALRTRRRAGHSHAPSE